MQTDNNEKENNVIEMEMLFPVLRRQLDLIDDEKLVFDKIIERQVLEKKFHLKDKKNRKPEIILESNTAVELGHPRVLSKSIILITEKENLVNDQTISVFGKNVDKLEPEKKHSLVQVLLLKVKKGQFPDPFKLETAQHLIHRLPGYMVRSVPGKLWVRISKDSLKNGLDFHVVGSALVSVIKAEFKEVLAVEVVFATSEKIEEKSLNTLYDEVEILAGRHKKLALGLDGDLECEELDCDNCDEQEVCDNLREIIKRKKDDG